MGSKNSSQINHKFYRCACFFTNNYFVKLENGKSAHLKYHSGRRNRLRHENYHQLRTQLGLKTTADIDSIIPILEKEHARRGALDSNFESGQKYLIGKGAGRISIGADQMNESPQIETLSEKLEIFRIGPIFKDLDDVVSRIMEFDGACDGGAACFKPPNTMNKAGVLLPTAFFNSDTLREYFSKFFPNNCDSQRTFTVVYGPDKDATLNRHYDNAELTANICLQNDDPENNGLLKIDDYGSIKQHPNYAIIHPGKLYHAAELSTANRANLIIWMRDSKIRAKRCPMCGDAPRLIGPLFDTADGFTLQPDSTLYESSDSNSE